MNNLFFSNCPNKLLPSTSFKSENKKESKLNFKKIQVNTINSLNEVECFLNDFQRFKNYIKLYKILK